MEELNAFLYPKYERIKHKVAYSHRPFNADKISRKVQVRCFIGDKFIKNFESIKEASRFYGIQYNKIVRGINNSPILHNNTELFFRSK